MSNIDDIKEEDTDIKCLNCKELLVYIPAQSGPCHSGLFVDHIKTPYYWCHECEIVIEPEQLNTTTGAEL